MLGRSGIDIVIRGIDKASGTFRQVSRSASGMGKAVSLAGGIAAGAVAGIVAAGAAAASGLTALGVSGVKTAMDYESAFAGVIKTTDGLTSEVGVLNEAGEELKRGFKDMAEEVPMSFEELARIGELGGQLGVAKDDLLDFTQTIAAISVSTDLTADAASMNFARIMNVMGTAGEDVDRLGSTVVELGNNFATTEPEIMSFAERIAASGKLAGLTEGDVLGISAAFRCFRKLRLCASAWG